MDATVDTSVQDQFPHRPKLSDWLWRPWFAKVWCSLIPLWWAGFLASSKIELLGDLYSGLLVGLLGIVFHPMAPLVVLGAGFARQWLDTSSPSLLPEVSSVEGEFCDDEDGDFVINAFTSPALLDDPWDWTKYGMPPPHMDIYNPRSGWLYVGTPGGSSNFS
jgi:hypothetical protein